MTDSSTTKVNKKSIKKIKHQLSKNKVVKIIGKPDKIEELRISYKEVTTSWPNTYEIWYYKIGNKFFHIRFAPEDFYEVKNKNLWRVDRYGISNTCKVRMNKNEILIDSKEGSD